MPHAARPLAALAAIAVLFAASAAAAPCGIWGGDTETWACSDLLMAGPPGALCVVLVPPLGNASAVCEYTACDYDAVLHECSPNVAAGLVGLAAGPCAAGFRCERTGVAECGCRATQPMMPVPAIFLLVACLVVVFGFATWPFLTSERRVMPVPVKQN